MAEQLNKLGKVLVYDSSVDLQDRSAGGKGFQSVTLDNAGAYIDGAITGKNTFIVKANGTPEENGKAFLEAWDAAKALDTIVETTTLEVDGSAITGRNQGYGTIGDTTIPFTGWGYGNDGGFAINNPTWDPTVHFANQNGNAYYTDITLVSTSGAECVVVIDGGGATATYFYFSVDRISSGTAFPMEELASIKYDSITKIKQHIIASPGVYKIDPPTQTQDFRILDGFIDISSADGQRSIILEEGSAKLFFKMSQEVTSDMVTITGLNGLKNNVAIGPATNSTFNSGIKFINCAGGQYSFMSGYNSYYYSHQIYDCESLEYSFASSNDANINPSVNDSIIQNCKGRDFCFGYNGSFNDTIIKNCDGGQKCFIVESTGSTDTYISDCRATTSSFLTHSILNTNSNFCDVIIKNCYAVGQNSFGRNYILRNNRDLAIMDCYAIGSNHFFSQCSGGSVNRTVMQNCHAQGNSAFGTLGYSLEVSFINCTGLGYDSFQRGDNVTSKVINCVSSLSNLSSVSGNGTIINSIDATNNLINL